MNYNELLIKAIEHIDTIQSGEVFFVKIYFTARSGINSRGEKNLSLVDYSRKQ